MNRRQRKWSQWRVHDEISAQMTSSISKDRGILKKNLIKNVGPATAVKDTVVSSSLLKKK